MLTRFVRIQLLIFTIASVIGVLVMTFSYIQAPTLLGIGRMTVTLELPSAGGLYRFANVTYRGVQIGTVTGIALTPGGAKATLSLSNSSKVPADLRAEVRSVSAVGEQYVDLRPRTGSPPYLHNGSVISMRDAIIPQPVGPVLDQANALINSIPKDKLGALNEESFKAFNGSGYDMGSLFDSAGTVVGDVNGVAGQTRALIEDSVPLLDSQAQTADSIRLWAHSMAGVTQQLADDDTQVRTLLRVAPGTAREATAMLEELKPTLPVLLANLASLGQVAVTYHPSFEQLLVLLPPVVAGLQSVSPRNNYTGISANGFHLQVGDPPPCWTGFLPPSEWRSPADTTTVDTPDGLYCKLPQDSPLASRGARNYPCMEHPGKRAPTVEICNSDKPYEPLAMRQHWTGPYPLDPNLLSQGIMPDDRIYFDLGGRPPDLYGPSGGSGIPPGAPPPPQAPIGPPPWKPPPPPPGQVWPINPAQPAEPYAPVPAPVPGSPGPGNRMAPAAAPPGPVDTAALPGDAVRSAPSAQSGPAAPPASPAFPVAPSSFGPGGSGPGPSIATAEYNPRTGSYVGPGGHVYRQADLAAADHPAQTPKTGKTWRDLILTRS